VKKGGEMMDIKTQLLLKREFDNFYDDLENVKRFQRYYKTKYGELPYLGKKEKVPCAVTQKGL